jgi:hypothetical protein
MHITRRRILESGAKGAVPSTKVAKDSQRSCAMALMGRVIFLCPLRNRHGSITTACLVAVAA